VIELSNIPEHLAEKINTIPAKPGIYQMKDSTGNIIYVGKSKNLRSRIRSYFVADHKWEKVKNMVFHINDIDIIVTDTHLEARMLECTLIKTIQPFYNVQFKNDKKYMYLKIEDFKGHKIATATYEKENENCFGPYKSRGILEEMINFFKNIYPVSKEENSYVFTYNMMPIPIGSESFDTNKNCLIEIFSQEPCMSLFLKQIELKMNLAAEAFQFETAIIYRDMLSNLKYLYYSNMQKPNTLTLRKVLMGEKLEDGYKLFYIAQGNIILKKKYKRLSKVATERFLIQAQTLEPKTNPVENEKSNLDFHYIINNELKDDTLKSILMIDEEYNLDAFISKLKK
jgi:excinuclease ABC subunit C